MISGQQVATRYDGLVVFNETQPLTTAKDLTLPIYEIGHALTIGHPGNVDISPANAPPPPSLPAAKDSYRFTGPTTARPGTARGPTATRSTSKSSSGLDICPRLSGGIVITLLLGDPLKQQARQSWPCA
jgi:hypothetical protein